MNCAGKNFGMLEMRTVLCAFLERFDMKLREGYELDAFERRHRDYFVATRPEVPVVLIRRA